MDAPDLSDAERYLAFYGRHRRSVTKALMSAGMELRDAELRVGDVFRRLQEDVLSGLSDEAVVERIRCIAREIATPGRDVSP